MSILSETAVQADPKAAHDAAEQLETMLNGDVTMAEAKVDDILRLVPGKRAIFSGHIADKPVVYRLLLSADERQTAATEWAEMQRAWAYMHDGPNRVAEPLSFDPEKGLLIVSHVDGTPLMEHLWAASPEQRVALMPRAAQWLRAFSQPTEVWKSPNRGPWLTWAEQAIARQPHQRLRGIEADILQKMKQLGRKFKGTEWRVAICHGDFHPNNLLLSGDTLTGIDIGGSAPMPIYKDIVRFLVHMSRRAMIPSGERHFGVCRAGFEAFAEAFDMTEVERDYILPFMIAYETLVRVEHPDFPATRIRHAHEMSEALFADLKTAAMG